MKSIGVHTGKLTQTAMQHVFTKQKLTDFTFLFLYTTKSDDLQITVLQLQIQPQSQQRPRNLQTSSLSETVEKTSDLKTAKSETARDREGLLGSICEERALKKAWSV